MSGSGLEIDSRTVSVSFSTVNPRASLCGFHAVVPSSAGSSSLSGIAVHHDVPRMFGVFLGLVRTHALFDRWDHAQLGLFLDGVGNTTASCYRLSLVPPQRYYRSASGSNICLFPECVGDGQSAVAAEREGRDLPVPAGIGGASIRAVHQSHHGVYGDLVEAVG